MYEVCLAFILKLGASIAHSGAVSFWSRAKERLLFPACLVGISPFLYGVCSVCCVFVLVLTFLYSSVIFFCSLKGSVPRYYNRNLK